MSDILDECVCCRCSENLETFDPTGMNAKCCTECRHDGMFIAWLEEAFEEWAENNPSMEKLPNGKWKEKE